MQAPRSTRRRLGHGFAFLLAAAGLGMCGYAWLQWRELPRYSEADIAVSAKLNLTVDLAREHRSLDQLPTAEAETRLAATEREIREEIAVAMQPVRTWAVVGLVLLALAAGRAWLSGAAAAKRG